MGNVVFTSEPESVEVIDLNGFDNTDPEGTGENDRTNFSFLGPLIILLFIANVALIIILYFVKGK